MNNWIDLDLARQVVEIARLASDEILKIYHSQVLNTQLKSDASPVTAADLAANEVINKGLNNLLVRWPIVSEENAEIPYSERSKFAYYWLVDPLDGTKEFVSRTDDFAVNIALVHHNRPILGVVYVPCTEGVYFAVKNEGAFKIENNLKEKIHCNAFKINGLNLKIPVSRSYLNEETKTLIA